MSNDTASNEEDKHQLNDWAVNHLKLLWFGCSVVGFFIGRALIPNFGFGDLLIQALFISPILGLVLLVIIFFIIPLYWTIGKRTHSEVKKSIQNGLSPWIAWPLGIVTFLFTLNIISSHC